MWLQKLLLLQSGGRCVPHYHSFIQTSIKIYRIQKCPNEILRVLKFLHLIINLNTVMLNCFICIIFFYQYIKGQLSLIMMHLENCKDQNLDLAIFLLTCSRIQCCDAQLSAVTLEHVAVNEVPLLPARHWEKCDTPRAAIQNRGCN